MNKKAIGIIGILLVLFIGSTLLYEFLTPGNISAQEAWRDSSIYKLSIISISAWMVLSVYVLSRQIRRAGGE